MAFEFTSVLVFYFRDSGATNPEYTITADDVDKLVAVECIPMNDQGHQVYHITYSN